MALKTLGTNATTSLSALVFNHSADVMLPADLAALNALIKPDSGGNGLMSPYLTYEGQLWIPRRGWVKVLNGDYVGVDATTGWPIVVSAAAIASGPYTHS